MKKQTLKTLLCLALTMVFVLGLSTSAFADSTQLTVYKYDTATKANVKTIVYTAEIYNDDQEIKTDVPAMLLNGSTLVPARAVTESLGAKITWDNPTKTATVTKGSKKIVLKIGSNTATVNGKSVKMGGNAKAELITYQGIARTMVPFRFIAEQLGAEVAWNNNEKRVTLNPYIEDTDDWKDWTDVYGIQVVIDPGHGGSDPGAVANDNLEKEINLEVAEIVAKNLKKKGLEVIMTRSEDEYLGLVERANVGTENKATIFVSLHCNSAENTTATGIETYYYINSDNEYDEDLATCIQKEVIKATGARDRGVKSANFSVLRNSVIPAALIEMGFISNPEESADIADPAYQKKIAQGVTNGIIKFLKNQDIY